MSLYHQLGPNMDRTWTEHDIGGDPVDPIKPNGYSVHATVNPCVDTLQYL